MRINLSAFFGILTSPPGDLIYHLVVGLSLILVVATASRKLSRSTIGRRAWHVWIGGLVLLLFQIILFCLRFFTVPTAEVIPAACILAEYLVDAIAVVCIVWTFIESNKQHLLTGLAIFICLALSCLSVFSLIVVSLQPDFLRLDASLLQTLWQVASLILALLGLVPIMIKRDDQWILGTAILILLAAGYTIQLTLLADQTSYMGAVRLAQVLSYPWMTLLMQRFAGNKRVDGQPDEYPQIKDKLVDTKPELMDLLLKIHTQETSAEKYRAVVQALSLSVVADICYIARIPEKGNPIQLIAGYDLIREEFLKPAELDRAELPEIINAWEAGEPAELSQTHKNTRDAITLTTLLNYHRIGNLLAYPLGSAERLLMGGVIFLSPYTDKRWGHAAIHQMETIRETLAQVIFEPDLQEKWRSELSEVQIQVITLLEEKKRIIQTLTEKEELIKQLNMELKRLKATYQIDRFEQVRQTDRMRERIRELTIKSNAQAGLSAKLEQMNESIRQLIKERDQLKTALEQANTRIKDLETKAGQTGPIRLSMENQIISLDSIAANARLGVASRLQQEQVKLEIVNPVGRQMIKIDPELLQTALQGLLENAVLASRPGKTILLNQKLSFETGMLIIQVTDYGEGLTPVDQKNLFSADYTAVPGIGSVAAIRNAIRAIRVLNGKVWLRSKKEDFTTFRVQLPVRIID